MLKMGMTYHSSGDLDGLVTLAARVGGGAWGEAISLWLSTRRSAATRRAYARALENLLVSTTAMPWEITHTEVLRWSHQMDAQGLSPATIAQRLAGVSSFYSFAMTEFYPAGARKPLHHSNPAAGKSLRPRVELYGKASYLGAEETVALLGAIPRQQLAGKRDYALFLGYILLARRNSEWRMVRWGDLERYGGQVMLRWSGKGKHDKRLELPVPVFAAVCDFLKSAGRLESMESGDHIFTALKRAGCGLPRGGTLAENCPLSAHEVGRLLKKYLRRAGLDGRKITPHSLRHTGATLLAAAGASDREVMEYLDHQNVAVTQAYLHQLTARKSSHWMTVSEMLGLSNFDR